jgi:phosphatidylglycerol:prolipoprotein diacylglycerol transferase
MHPILTAFHIRQLDWLVQVQSYALLHLVALAAFSGLTVRFHARQTGSSVAAVDVLLAAVPAGLAGAALLGAITSGVWPGLTLEDFWRGHKSAYGGLLAGAFAGAIALRSLRLDAWPFFDAATPGLALGAFFCRIGCFLGGCCWGRPTASRLAVRFPPDHDGMLRLPDASWGLHPTQLYLAAAALAVAAVALVMRRRGRARPGGCFLTAAALYGASAFCIEALRDDPGRWFALGLSHNQWISAAIAAAIAARALLAARDNSAR